MIANGTLGNEALLRELLRAAVLNRDQRKIL